MTDPKRTTLLYIPKRLVRKWQADIVIYVDMDWWRRREGVPTVENDQSSEPRCLLNLLNEIDSDFWAISQVRIKALGF